MQNFYNEISPHISGLLDTIVEGELMQCIVDYAKGIIKRMAVGSSICIGGEEKITDPPYGTFEENRRLRAQIRELQEAQRIKDKEHMGVIEPPCDLCGG